MDDATFIRLRQHVDAAGVDLPAHYLAIPPALFGTVITKLVAAWPASRPEHRLFSKVTPGHPQSYTRPPSPVPLHAPKNNHLTQRGFVMCPEA